MSKLSDRAAYIRGLADGMKLNMSEDQGRLFSEVMKLFEDVTLKIEEMDKQIKDLNDYVEDVDSDLGELESIVYEEECDDEDCCCCHGHDDDGDDEDEDDHCGCGCHCDCDEDGTIHIHCPNCGKPVDLNPADIEDMESPVCEYCGEPFFTDIEIDEDEADDEEYDFAGDEKEDTDKADCKHKAKKHKK